MYKEDFDAERSAREETVDKLGKVREQVASRDKTIKEYQELLNRQAATEFQAEFGDVSGQYTRAQTKKSEGRGGHAMLKNATF